VIALFSSVVSPLGRSIRASAISQTGPLGRECFVQNKVEPKRLRELPLILPPLSLQEKFAVIAHKYECLRSQQQEALRQAEMLFGALLKRAFEGEV